MSVETEKIKKYSDRWFLSLYLKYGSVEEAIRSYPESLPISIAAFHRLARKYGLVKSAGRHVSLPETLHFFRQKAMSPGEPLEQLYRQMPPSFQTSLATLHRIYQYMEKKTVRRYGAALILTKEGDDNSVLVGQELFGNSRYGKRVGDVSVPMGFAKKDEGCLDSALRILQQEVFSGLAAEGKLKVNSDITEEIFGNNLEPLAYFNIVDVRVSLYKAVLPSATMHYFDSYKLAGHRFENIFGIDEKLLRTGVSEIFSIYENSLYSPSVETRTYISSINVTEVVTNHLLA